MIQYHFILFFKKNVFKLYQYELLYQWKESGVFMRNNKGNIARELERIILETLKMSHSGNIMPPIIRTLSLQTPYGLIAIGKASVSMADTFLNNVSVEPDVCPVLTSKAYIPKNYHEKIRLFMGEHPYPGNKTGRSSVKILDMLQKRIPGEGLIILLLSGGGSSLFEIPRGKLSVLKIASVTKELMLKGADIYELNTVRKHLSDVKGGGFARHLYPRKIMALIMSDVMGDPLDVIASGPVTPDTSSDDDARRILKKYNLDASIIPKEDTNASSNNTFNHVKTHIIANNNTLLHSCHEYLQQHKIPVYDLPYHLSGEASRCGLKIAKTIDLIRGKTKSPFYLIGGGETHVTVKGNGKGGRNMELVLSTALNLSNTNYSWAITSVGSDGIDGPTDAAGAIMTDRNMQNFDYKKAEKHLINNDSYTFFKEKHSLIKTGYTGINLNDLFIAFIH
jgi:glycerate 2-kinase